jgi:hypothetical protein
LDFISHLLKRSTIVFGIGTNGKNVKIEVFYFLDSFAERAIMGRVQKREQESSKVFCACIGMHLEQFVHMFCQGFYEQERLQTENMMIILIDLPI